MTEVFGSKFSSYVSKIKFLPAISTGVSIGTFKISHATDLPNIKEDNKIDTSIFHNYKF